MFCCEKLNFRYAGIQENSLRDICLELQQGECLLLCGSSGSGKTTLTRCLNGLIPRFFEGEFSGHVRFGKENFHDLDIHHIAENTGSVFQDPRSQFFTTDVTSELAFGPENYGFTKREISNRIETVAKLLSINHLLGCNLFALSSGEKQKVAIAAALTLQPSTIILDEPSANLDPTAIEELKDLLFLLKKEGYTIIISEHRFFFLSGLVDRALHFEKGEVVRSWNGDDFFRLSHAEAEVKGLRFPNFAANRECLNNFATGIPQGTTATDNKILSLKDISYCYKKDKVLDGFSLDCHRGEIVAITGDNGAGKTTLLRLIAGLAKEQSGAVWINGKKQSPKRRRQICTFVMQDADYQLFTESVFQELYLGNEKQQGIKEKIERALKHFGLWELREWHPNSLSGGQKQRLTIALSMVNHSDIVLLDEPTSGLDQVNMQRVADLLRELAALDKAVIVATHDYEFIEKCCSRLIEIPVTAEQIL